MGIKTRRCVFFWNGLLLFLSHLVEQWSVNFLHNVLPALLLQAPSFNQHSVQCHYDPGKWGERVVSFSINWFALKLLLGRLTDIEDRLVFAKGEGFGAGKDWEFRTRRCKLVSIKWINNRVLLCLHMELYSMVV